MNPVAPRSSHHPNKIRKNPPLPQIVRRGPLLSLNEQGTQAKLIANVVHIPTGLAYVWIILGFVTASLMLYAFFMAAAVWIRLFKDFQNWPAISKLALFSGPLLMALGLYFSTIQTTYYMLIPLVVYYSITTFGWRAIASKSKEPR